VDACAAALRGRSARAARVRQGNVLYVRAAVEDLPPELTGLADRVTVVLPWGSLLVAMAGPSSPVLPRVRGLCQPGARLTVVLGIDHARDRTECLRLGLPAIDLAHLHGPLAEAYAAAGFERVSARALTATELARWPSTWARRLGRDPARTLFQLDARAAAT
jgi:16S rRNA (adenine(1408)-N(1))-methyltransferase